MFLQLPGYGLVGLVILAGDHGSCGILVNPMYDAGTHHPVDTGEFLSAVIKQGIYQGPGVMPCRRVDHHALGLVHHNHVPVLIEDVQGDIFRQDVRCHRFRQEKGYLVICLHQITALHRPAIDLHGAFLDHLLDKGARQRIDKPGQELIDSFFFHFFCYFIVIFAHICIAFLPISDCHEANLFLYRKNFCVHYCCERSEQ